MTDSSQTPPPPPPAGSPGTPPGRPPTARRPQRRRPVRRAVSDAAKPDAVQCPQCAGRVEVRDQKGTVMVVCGHCGSALDVSVPGKAQLLHTFEKARKSAGGNPIELGAKGKWKGQVWEAIGRIRWIEREGAQVWRWDEIQLRAENGRMAFLTLEEGHWTWSEPLRRRITRDPRYLGVNKTFREWGKNFRVHEKSLCKVDYVEGELTWVAAKDDPLQFMDAVSPPEMLSAEWTGQEMEWSMGRWLAPATVAKIFGIDPAKMPPMVGVAPHQPFDQDPIQGLKVKVGLAFGLALLLVALIAAVWPGKKVLDVRIPAIEYLSEAGATTPAFELPNGPHICRLEVEAPVDNTWVALDVGILDERDDVLIEADGEIERYHGRDSEGSWSEGSGDDSQLFRLMGPGSYRLAVFGSSGTWPESAAVPQHDVHLVVRRGVFPVRYALLAALIALLYPLKEGGRFLSHRAAQAPEDDD